MIAKTFNPSPGVKPFTIMKSSGGGAQGALRLLAAR
jgi:hypothetical protein